MNGVRTHGRRATWLGGDRGRRPNALNNKANGAIVSPNLDDNMPEVLRTLRTQPLFVMRLNVRRLQIVGATPGAYRRIGVVPGSSFEGEEAFRRSIGWRQ